MLIAQISDCHIVDRGELFADRVDSAAGLRAAVATINDLDLQPDVVLGTGDLVNDGTAAQYDHLVELLAPLQAPFVPLPGNHDDRAELRLRYPDLLPPGDRGDPIDSVIDDHAVRLVVLDTTIPGRHDGTLSTAQLAWLDQQLHAAPEQPTIVVQHHPPVSTGVGRMDADCGFDAGAGEAEVIGRHPQVEAIVCGHLHRSIQRRYAGSVLIVCPSTASQLFLDLRGETTRYTSEPTGILLHHWRVGVGLTSHLVPIGTYDSWRPPWAT